MVREISLEEFKKHKQEFFLLDVRTLGEFEDDRLEDAFLIPLDQLNQRHDEITVDKDSKIAVICRSGNRSNMACQILTMLGYSNLYNISDGMIGY